MVDEIDWGKIHSKLFGYPIEMNEPPPELLVVEKAIGVLAASFLKKGRLVSSQIKREVRAAGFPSGHVPLFHSLQRSRTLHWPQMEDDQRRGLSLALNLLSESGVASNVFADPGLIVNCKDSFDSVAGALGNWGRTKLLGEFLRDYLDVLNTFADEFGRELSVKVPGSESALLSVYIQQELKKRPFNYQFGHLLKEAVELAFY